jgi:hypothetical protein
VIAERAALEDELGDAAAGVLILEASLTLAQHPYRRRVLAVAVRA